MKRKLVPWFRPRQHLSEKEVERQFKSSFGDTRSYSGILSAYYQMGGSLRKQKKRDIREKAVTMKDDALVASQPETTSASPEYHPSAPKSFSVKQPAVQRSGEPSSSVEGRPPCSESDRARNLLNEEPPHGVLIIPGEFQAENSCGESLPASAVGANPPRVLSNVSGLPGQGRLEDYNATAPQNTEPNHPQQVPDGDFSASTISSNPSH